MASAALPIAQAGFSFMMNLLAAHDKRIQLAKQENTAVAQAVTALDTDLKTVFTALNNGDMTEAVAIASFQDIEKWYWLWITPFTQNQNVTEAMCNATVLAGGRGASSDNPVGCGSSAGGKECTAACCIGCAVIVSACRQGVKIVQAHGATNTLGYGVGTIQVPGVAANKYGLPARAAYNLTYKPPKVKNPEAEVTLNTKTGILTVGATPSPTDVVIATGVTTVGASPDTGGDQIQHTPAGTDVASTTLAPAGAGLSMSLILIAIVAIVVLLIAAK